MLFKKGIIMRRRRNKLMKEKMVRRRIDRMTRRMKVMYAMLWHAMKMMWIYVV
jgi:cell division protein FtsL